MKEITPEIEALCGLASASIGTEAEQQPRQQETQEQPETDAGAAVSGALEAAPDTAVAPSWEARNTGAWGERGSTGGGSWRRERAEDTPKVPLLSPYLFPVRPRQPTAGGRLVPPVGSHVQRSPPQSRRSEHRSTASRSSGEGDGGASGGSAGVPVSMLRPRLSKKPPPVRFSPGGGVNSVYSVIATSGGGFQRRYATGMEGNDSAATTKSALAGAAVYFGAARYVYGAETDGSDCDSDAGSAFDDDGSGMEGRRGSDAAVAGRGASETAQGDGNTQWKHVLLPDTAAQDMWGIQTQDSGNEGEGMWAHREIEVGAGGGEHHEQGKEQGLEDGEVEEEIEEEEEEEEGKNMAARNVLTPPPVEESNQRGKHDRAVLMALFDRCRGPMWVCSSNWGSEEPLSTWYNVFVDRGGHVQQLTLPRNKLSGEHASLAWALACDNKVFISSCSETTSVI